MRGSAIPDREGWIYGVRFGDGSIRAVWSGRTQRERVETEMEHLRSWHRRVRPMEEPPYAMVRRRIGEPWEDV